MSGAAKRRYDVAVVGAGPVGSVCALAHARKGARVVLLEANPNSSRRLAGEWLHPPAVRILREIGIDLLPRGTPGKGFVVFPEDGSDPIPLPYPDEYRGLICDHATLVSSLREATENEADIDFIAPARVKAVDDGQLNFSVNGDDRTITAERIVGADGRASIVRRSLGFSMNPVLYSRMLGVTIREAELPFEGYGHVVLGGPGPILIYALADNCVRVIVDIPPDRWSPGTGRLPVGILRRAAAGGSRPGFRRSAAGWAIPCGRQPVEPAHQLRKCAPGGDRRRRRALPSPDGSRHDARIRRCAGACGGREI